MNASQQSAFPLPAEFLAEHPGATFGAWQHGMADPYATGPEPWKADVVRVLKETLIKELVCVVRCNHLMDGDSVQPLINAEFLLHAYDELAHAHQLSRCITQLGGELDYSPARLLRMGRTLKDGPHDLDQVIQDNLMSHFQVILKCNELVAQLDEDDLEARQILKEIADEQREHARELRAWLLK